MKFDRQPKTQEPRQVPIEPDTKDKIRPDGMRYASKKAVNSFGSGTGVVTMSCFKCGRHREHASMQSQKILGKVRRVCSKDSGGCK